MLPMPLLGLLTSSFEVLIILSEAGLGKNLCGRTEQQQPIALGTESEMRPRGTRVSRGPLPRTCPCAQAVFEPEEEEEGRGKPKLSSSFCFPECN